MNNLLAIFFISITIFSSEQSKVNFKNLTNSWTQGKIESNGNVIKANASRGGWYNLKIKKDNSVIFSDPFNCGIGHEHQGNWTINKLDKTVTFIFTKQVGYVNSPGNSEINETEIYKIEKLTKTELILTKVGQEKTLPFIRIENPKE
jgi:hypothetical protein